MPTVDANPGPFTFDTDSTVLLVIDMQRDFLLPGGFGESLGNDVSQLSRTIEPLSALMAAWRAAGLPIVHTREGHLPDLSDCPPAKLARGGIGEQGAFGRILVRGEYGHDIVDELAPLDGEIVVDKPGKGAFYATELSDILDKFGARRLIVTGVTTEVCVHTTVREANDRGYECLLLSDCCAATDPGNHAAALKMIKMQNGVFGAVSTSAALLEALP